MYYDLLYIMMWLMPNTVAYTTLVARCLQVSPNKSPAPVKVRGVWATSPGPRVVRLAA